MARARKPVTEKSAPTKKTASAARSATSLTSRTKKKAPQKKAQQEKAKSPEDSLETLLHRPILTQHPKYLDPASAWVDHLPFAFWIIDALRPARLVELGTHDGLSYCGFCQAADVLKLPSRCYAIGSWGGDTPSAGAANELFVTLKRYHDPLYAHLSELVRSYPADAVDKFADSSIDLLHIDSVQDAQAVAKQFNLWLPKLSKSAVVLLHNTNAYEGQFTLQDFWRECAEQFPHFEFLHGRGLGVLAVGKQPNPYIKWLTSTDEATTHAVRDEFARLARPLLDQVDLLAKNNRLRQQIDRVEVEKLSAQDRELTLNNALEDLQAKHQQLGEYSEQLHNEVERLTAANKELQTKRAKPVAVAQEPLPRKPSDEVNELLKQGTAKAQAGFEKANRALRAWLARRKN